MLMSDQTINRIEDCSSCQYMVNPCHKWNSVLFGVDAPRHHYVFYSRSLLSISYPSLSRLGIGLLGETLWMSNKLLAP